MIARMDSVILQNRERILDVAARHGAGNVRVFGSRVRQSAGAGLIAVTGEAIRLKHCGLRGLHGRRFRLALLRAGWPEREYRQSNARHK